MVIVQENVTANVVRWKNCMEFVKTVEPFLNGRFGFSFSQNLQLSAANNKFNRIIFVGNKNNVVWMLYFDVRKLYYLSP